MTIDKSTEGKDIVRRRKPGSRERFSPEDIEFMNSLSAAVLAGTPAKSNLLLGSITLIVFILILWANIAKLDERTRGIGRVIPSRQIQVVQNLEGGIVGQILVAEGDAVKKDQVLVVIDDTGAGSSFAESTTVINELKARAVRLKAEAGNRPFETDTNYSGVMADAVKKERQLYDTNVLRKMNEKMVLEQRLKQREIEQSEARLDIETLKKALKMIAREVELTHPLVVKGLVSELEYIQLKQKELDKKYQYESAQKKAENLSSKIIEAKNQIQEFDARYRSEAQEEYNKVMAEIERLDKTHVAIQDRVDRTQVRSPVDGTVKRMLINTIGGVVKPGMDIVEIVPDEEKILVEAKIRPADIAFLHPGLKAVVKLTAYDFAIYGGLDGVVRHISADTITDERQEEYYLVRVETNKDFLGTEDNKKEIMVGMTAQVDIITGKKSIMHYLMKPILRAKENALREK